MRSRRSRSDNAAACAATATHEATAFRSRANRSVTALAIPATMRCVGRAAGWRYAAATAAAVHPSATSVRGHESLTPPRPMKPNAIGSTAAVNNGCRIAAPSAACVIATCAAAYAVSVPSAASITRSLDGARSIISHNSTPNSAASADRAMRAPHVPRVSTSAAHAMAIANSAG